jgi:Ca2+-binding RTX toxin-like protein
MAFDAVIHLSTLTAAEGAVLPGVLTNGRAGHSVSTAGDLNGDGIDDFVVSAPYADYGVNGAVYVVFGKTGNFNPLINLSTLDGTNGFRITSETNAVALGCHVDAAGDLNGDGVDDLIIGARRSSTAVNNGGAAYVVFGQTTPFAAELSVASLDGSNGFQIDGFQALGRLGDSVAGTGDINGDGFDDVAIGMAYGDSYGSGSGTTFVVFGTDQGHPANLSAADLDGSNGFTIVGAQPGSRSGCSVAAAGDVNGDGWNDLLIGARLAAPGGVYRAGEAYLVYGDGDGFGSELHLAALTGATGMRMSGATAFNYAGSWVSGVGDINGDGLADFAVGAVSVATSSAGAAYIVFGSDDGLPASLNLEALDGTNGFIVRGLSAGDLTGRASGPAGDLNGDGVDDLVLGARGTSTNGAQSGSAYVIFGKTTAFAASFDLATLDGVVGFELRGVSFSDQAGWSVEGGGDFNNDGVEDLLVGAAFADPFGNSNAGAAYVIYGRADPMTLVGGGGADTLIGGAAGDSLSGLDGQDVLEGRGGNDNLDGGDMSDLLRGGDGEDSLIGGAGGDIMYGDNGDDDLGGGSGGDKLFGGLGQDELGGDEGNDRLDGGEASDALFGGAGNDYLDGGFGGDMMFGEDGNDVYLVDDLGDLTVEGVGWGYDIVQTALDGWVLGLEIEGLALLGAGDISGTGNGLANNLQGNSGANTLRGGAGTDTLNGNDGDDIIVGGEGNDLLRGGLGADTFLVDHAFGANLETDQVYDFSTAEGDLIDLSGIDAIAGGADDAFTLVAGFSKAAGQMTLTFSGGVTTLKLDVTGDGKADYQMKINGDVTGDSGGWLF